MSEAAGLKADRTLVSKFSKFLTFVPPVKCGRAGGVGYYYYDRPALPWTGHKDQHLQHLGRPVIQRCFLRLGGKDVIICLQTASIGGN